MASPRPYGRGSTFSFSLPVQELGEHLEQRELRGLEGGW